MHIRKIWGYTELPIILLVAFGREDMMQQATAAGVNGFLMKPVKPSLLFDTIMKLFAHDRFSGASRQASAIVSDPQILEHIIGARILLVEDNPVNQHVTAELLKKAGLIVDIANNGSEALQAMRLGRYDAVLMDLQMPVMDGYEATREIRKDPENHSLPIIALTAHAMKGAREKCLKAGMNDYLSKPIVIEQLFIVLARWLSGRSPQAVQTRAEKSGDPGKEHDEEHVKADMSSEFLGEQESVSGGWPLFFTTFDELLDECNLKAEEYFGVLREHLQGNAIFTRELQLLERNINALDFENAKAPLREIARMFGIPLKGNYGEQ